MKYFKANSPDDMAKIPRGTYWLTKWNPNFPIVVDLCLHQGHRYITDGCEYRDSLLTNFIEEYPDAIFYGPLVPPDFNV